MQHPYLLSWVWETAAPCLCSAAAAAAAAAAAVAEVVAAVLAMTAAVLPAEPAAVLYIMHSFRCPGPDKFPHQHEPRVLVVQKQWSSMYFNSTSC